MPEKPKDNRSGSAISALVAQVQQAARKRTDRKNTNATQIETEKPAAAHRNTVDHVESAASAAIGGSSGSTAQILSPSSRPNPTTTTPPNGATTLNEPHGAVESSSDAQVAHLIDVYFELEEPAERDALFDEVVQVDSALVLPFLRAMMNEDEDELIRAKAAAALARRGDRQGREALHALLNAAEALLTFDIAVDALTELANEQDPELFGILQAIWLDPTRPAEHALHAMAAMERLDAARAMADFISFIDEIDDVACLPEEQVEAAVLAFLRNDHQAAVPALADLHDRLVGGGAIESGDGAQSVDMADRIKEWTMVLTGRAREPS